MKRITLSVISILVFISIAIAQGQYQYKNKGFFNLSKINYNEVTRMEEDDLVKGINNIIYYNTGNIHGVGVQTINGWFLGPFISVGIGVGYDYYNKPKLSVFPVFFDLRIYFSNSHNSFFLYSDIGTILGSEKTSYTTGLFSAGLGYKFFIGNKHCFLASIGFDGKQFSNKGYGEPNPIHAFTLNSTVVSISYLF